jgi:hypothetical protein
MAAATKSIDTDFLSLRTVFARNTDNTKISSTKVLVADGNGGTFWAAPQLLGSLPVFNAIETSATKYIATETNRTLRLTAGEGISMNSSTLYGTTFLNIDVSGAANISSSKIKIATTGFISAHTDSNTNTIFLSSSKTAPALSTGDLYFQQLKVISSVQDPIDTTPFRGNSLFESNKHNFYTTLAAVGPLAFSSFTTTKQVFLSMYPYSASGFLTMSTVAGSIFISSLSTISSIYVTTPDFSTGMLSISTIEYLNHSTNVSTLVKLSNDSQVEYSNSVGNTLARAFYVQMTTYFDTLNKGLSTVTGVKTTKDTMLSTNTSIFINTQSRTTSSLSTFADSGLGALSNFTAYNILVFSTQLSTLSTSLGLNIFTMSNTVSTSINNFNQSTVSTFNQLGSLGYVSSLSLTSTIVSLPYISTKKLVSTIGSLNIVSSQSLLSTFSLKNQLDFYTDRSTFTQNVQSTVKGINENAPYISSLTLQSTLQSTFIFNNYINTSLASTSKGIIDYGSFNGYVSSISTFTPQGYVYSSNLNSALYSTTNAVFSRTSTISTLTYKSTFDTLGQIYISTANSTILACFTSSIGYNGSRGSDKGSTYIVNTTNNPYTAYGFINDIYFSTAQLNITSMSTFIVSTSKVQIDFNLSFYFPTTASSNDSYTNVNRLVPISSFLQYIPKLNDPPSFLSLTNGTFTEYINMYYDSNDTTNQTNNSTYDKRISFLYSGDDIIKTYGNFITLKHRVLFAKYYENVDPACNITYINCFPSLTNSIFVTIYN